MASPNPARKHHAFVVGSRVCLVDQDLVNTFVKNPNHLANIVEACQKNQPVGEEQVFILSSKTPDVPQAEGALPSMLNVQVTTAKCPPPVLSQIVTAAKSVKQLNKPPDVWTENSTKLLIKLCKENYFCLDNDETADGDKVWEEISQKLNENFNGPFSAMHCKSKWKALVGKLNEDKEKGLNGSNIRFNKEVEEVLNMISSNLNYGLDMEVTPDVNDVTVEEGLQEQMETEVNVVPILCSGNWNDLAIMELITLYKENKTSVPSKSGKVMWKTLALKLKDNTYNFSAEEVEDKWKELTLLYYKYKNNNEVPTSRNQFAPFYPEMVECFVKSTSPAKPQEVKDTASSSWTKESVMSLISLYKKHQNLLSKSVQAEGWKKVQEDLRAEGFVFNIEEITSKWKKLFSRYEICLRAGTYKKIPAYREMHEIFSGTKTKASPKGAGDAFTPNGESILSDEGPVSPPPPPSPSISLLSDDEADDLFDIDLAKDADVIAGNIAATLQKIHAERLEEDRKLRKSMEIMHGEKMKIMASIVEMLKELKK